MADFARSDDPAVQCQLDRLSWVAPQGDRLGLDRIAALLDRLGRPQERLPPVFHVAGTNGKGSACAVLRAGIERAGMTAHVFTSPHLIRFNERIRVAGRLIADDRLAALLERVIDAGEGLGASFFEVATATALVAFTETPADATILEVGLGGRLDATNIVPCPAACGIASLGIDHQAFLGDDPPTIAAEKAGIARRDVPLVTLAYPDVTAEAVARTAAAAGAPLMIQDRDWSVLAVGGALHYRDAAGELVLATPTLAGAHQRDNAGLAVAMLRHQTRLALPDAAVAAAPGLAVWPARLQRITQGEMLDRLPPAAALWIDGAHNPAAAALLAAHFADHARPLTVVIGLLDSKDRAGVVEPLARIAARVAAVPIAGHADHDPATIAADARASGVEAEAYRDIPSALDSVPSGHDVLIVGSLHLAGLALALNGSPPA